MTDTWICVKEAAALAGYSAPYFREIFCGAEPLVKIRARAGEGGRRTIFVSKESVMDMMKGETVAPRTGGVEYFGAKPPARPDQAQAPANERRAYAGRRDVPQGGEVFKVEVVRNAHGLPMATLMPDRAEAPGVELEAVPNRSIFGGMGTMVTVKKGADTVAKRDPQAGQAPRGEGVQDAMEIIEKMRAARRMAPAPAAMRGSGR